MDEDIFEEKKKLSPAALTAIIAGGVVVIAVIALVVYFAFFRTGSLVDDWHDEGEVVQYTFYKDNKMIVGTPYGDYIGQYVYDKETRKGIISIEGGTLDFTFEKDKVILGNGGILTRGRINVVHITVPPQESTEETETTTTPTETTPAVVTTETAAATTVPETTATATTVPETTAAATTVAETTAVITVPETAAVTTVAETTPAATTTDTPIATVSFPTFGFVLPTFTFGTTFPTWSFVVGTPVEGNWTDPATGEWLLHFSEDGICTITWGTWSYGSFEYEYNFFSGSGTMTVYTSDFEFQVTGDEMILKNITADTEQLFTRST